jgi:polysaccharide pyruvyl transferase WcaK-like protein
MATVVLLTPYTGGNLGDAAIQEAVIANVRSRLPTASVVMASLSPEDTTRIHGVRSFPIGVTTFGPGIPDDGASGSDLPSTALARKRLASRLTPRRIARALHDKASRALRSALYWTGLAELNHVVRTAALLRGARMLVVSGGGHSGLAFRSGPVVAWA